MGKEFRNTFIACILLTVLIPPAFGAWSMQDFLLGAAFTALGTALLALFTGLILLVAGAAGSATRRYGLACLLSAGILLLASFTLCTSGAVGMI